MARLTNTHVSKVSRLVGSDAKGCVNSSEGAPSGSRPCGIYTKLGTPSSRGARRLSTIAAVCSGRQAQRCYRACLTRQGGAAEGEEAWA